MPCFFDADIAVIGSGRGLDCFETPATMIPWMDHYHISSTLVYDRGMMECGQFRDFSRILKFCCEAPDRLFPTVPIAPPATGENPPPDELIEILLAEGIKGVRVWPEFQACDFDPFNFGILLEKLQAHRIPVFVHISEIHPWTYRTGWKNLAETARAFPALPLVLLWSGMRNGRQVFPLLDQCPNIRFDLTCVTGGFIEYVVERWGAGRLITASHYPFWDPGIFQAWVNYSGISVTDRERVAGGNVARLVEDIR
jgi:predicted TIM-barrel fold metal-dependent hydrolase